MNRKFINILMWILVISTVCAQPTYDTTNITSSNDFYELTYHFNRAVGGLVGLAFILVPYAITFFMLAPRVQSTIGVLAAANFVGLLISLILLPLGFIGFSVYTIMLILLATSAAGALLLNISKF